MDENTHPKVNSGAEKGRKSRSLTLWSIKEPNEIIYDVKTMIKKKIVVHLRL